MVGSKKIAMFYPPCKESELLFVQMNFRSHFDLEAPEHYQKLLKRTNGLTTKLGVIWPGVVKEQTKSLSTIFSANQRLKQFATDRYVFFGSTAEGWLTFDRRQRSYTLTNQANLHVIRHFESCKSMLLSILVTEILP
jgi:hypothetical protein